MEKHDISVLAIDDDEIAVDIVGDMLDQFGIQDVHTAKDGRSGLRVMAKMPTQPKFIIVDVFMPDMDGIEFLGELTKRQFMGGVILISALDPKMLQLARQIAVESGLKLLAVLSKPFKKEALAAALGIAESGMISEGHHSNGANMEPWGSA